MSARLAGASSRQLVAERDLAAAQRECLAMIGGRVGEFARRDLRLRYRARTAERNDA